MSPSLTYITLEAYIGMLFVFFLSYEKSVYMSLLYRLMHGPVCIVYSG